MDFFITGMPRSKTAWFSLYFTHDNFKCYHEFIANHGIYGLYARHEDPLIRAGISDSALLNYWEDLDVVYPNIKWIIIERDFVDCKRSCLKFGLTEHIIMSAKKQFDRILDFKQNSKNAMVVPFDFTMMNLEEMCDHVGMKFDHEYSEVMMKMNVQMSAHEADRLRVKHHLE